MKYAGDSQVSNWVRRSRMAARDGSLSSAARVYAFCPAVHAFTLSSLLDSSHWYGSVIDSPWYESTTGCFSAGGGLVAFDAASVASGKSKVSTNRWSGTVVSSEGRGKLPQTEWNGRRARCTRQPDWPPSGDALCREAERAHDFSIW